MKKISLILSSILGTIALVACNSGGSTAGGNQLSLTVSPPNCNYYYSPTPATTMEYQLENTVPGHQYIINMYWPNDIEESTPSTRVFTTATSNSYASQESCQPVPPPFGTSGTYQVKVIAFDITASQQSGSLVKSNTVIVNETMNSSF